VSGKVGPQSIGRGWQAQLYPTVEQAIRLNAWTGMLRFVWNHLLALEKQEYRATKKFLWQKQLQPIAVALKRQLEFAWLADLPAHAVLDTVARLDGALRRMVSERKAGRRCGFPRFKKKFIREARIYCVGQATTILGREAFLPKIGRIKLRGGDLPYGRLLNARVWRDGHRWMLSAQYECPHPGEMPETGSKLGIDVGLTTTVTAFDGSDFIEISAPRHLRKALKKLRRAQRRVARRQKGSNRRKAAGQRVTALHRRVRHLRQNFLHQTSCRLIAKADRIKLETLNIKGMIKNRRLALSIADAGLGGLARMLQYKGAWYGRTVEKIDPWFPSTQLCFLCRAKNHAMKELKRRIFECLECKHREGRDRNAARNIYWCGEELAPGSERIEKCVETVVRPPLAEAVVDEARILA